MPAIDEQMPAALEMPAEHRKARERCLCDDPELKRQRAEDHRRVVMALVIGDEDVGGAGRHALEALDGDADAGRVQDQARPRTRARVRDAPAPIEHAREERHRAEHNGVDGDGGNEKENSPPPMVGRDAHNLQLRIRNYE
jgi:hypothetical protein